jgi:hypothetical protein
LQSMARTTLSPAGFVILPIRPSPKYDAKDVKRRTSAAVGPRQVKAAWERGPTGRNVRDRHGASSSQFLGRGRRNLMKGGALQGGTANQRPKGEQRKGPYPAIPCADVLTTSSYWPSGGCVVYFGHLPQSRPRPQTPDEPSPGCRQS